MPTTLPSVQDTINKFVGTVPDAGQTGSPNMTNAEIFGVRAAGAGSPASGGPANSPQPSSVAPSPNPIATSGIRRYPDAGGAPATPSPYDAAAATYYNGLPKTVDEAKIRSDAQAAITGQLSAIDNVYASMLSQQGVTNANNAGRTRATSARSGVLGSDFGNAAAATTDQAGTDALNKIDAEKNAKIQELMGAANVRADQQIATEKTQAQKNSESYLAYLKTNKDQTITDISNYAKAGVNYHDLSDPEYKTLLDQSGLSPEKFHALFVLNQPVAAIATSSVSAGPTGNSTYHVVTRDAQGNFKTESIDLGFKVPSTYKVQNLGNGNVMFYDEKDPSKHEIYSAGTNGAGTDTATQKNQMNDAIIWMRTQPGYSASDDEAFKTDPVFQATMIRNAEAAKKATTSGSNPY